MLNPESLTASEVGKDHKLHVRILGPKEIIPYGIDVLNAWLETPGASIVGLPAGSSMRDVNGRGRVTLCAEKTEAITELLRILRSAEKYGISYQDLRTERIEDL
ncbi:hypothetical protein ACFLY9_00935 [Patescibacteria group bacterium]